MSEERPQHPQEPAEGAEEAEDAPGVERAGEEDDGGCTKRERRGPSSTRRSPPREPKRPRRPRCRASRRLALDPAVSCLSPRSERVGAHARA
jgi:hypothetical protein